MPSQYRIKTYVSNSYYHIYNRGVEKRIIFQDEQDYKVFLSYLKLYLTTPPILQGPSLTNIPKRQLNNHSQTINLLSYCLMPNHFHLMIKQIELDSMQRFMRSLATKYAIYFNKKYDRVGPLYQSRYKAILIPNENYFLYLTKYIHRNPLTLPSYKDRPLQLFEYPFSSYKNYLNKIHQTWVQPQEILDLYSTTSKFNSYRQFVEEELSKTESTVIKDLVLD